MRNASIKCIASLDQLVGKIFPRDAVFDFLEGCVAGANLVGGKLAEGSFLCVVLHLHNHVLHGLYVAYELNQRLCVCVCVCVCVHVCI